MNARQRRKLRRRYGLTLLDPVADSQALYLAACDRAAARTARRRAIGRRRAALHGLPWCDWCLAHHPEATCLTIPF